MCGICGVLRPEFEGPVETGLIANMLQAIIHRGPDGDGTYFDDRVALGMRRLSIIDVEGGQQPMFSEDGSIVVVFNGELYNYLDLRAQLIQRGHTLTTHCDTEVIAHLYEDFGVDCLQHLRGMFGLAVWDAREQRLLIARDRLGIKPLYYAHPGSTLVFASEIKAILQHPAVRAELDTVALSDFLTLRYVPSPRTLFANISLLPPGHRAVADRSGFRVEQYWDVSFVGSETQRNDQDYEDELESLLRECVQSHLMSDVPFGAFLSGGVDSSTVVALMSQFMNEPVKTFSVGFKGEGEEDSELGYARLVADHFKTQHHEVIFSAEDFASLMSDTVWHLDQPVSDYPQIAYYVVSRLAAQHVKMVLTGEGGDELFAGYGRYAGERYAPLFSRVPGLARTAALSVAGSLPGMRRPKSALYALLQSDEASRFTHWIPQFNTEDKAQLLTSDLRHTLQNHSTPNIVGALLKATDATHPLNRLQYMDLKYWLPDYLLSRGDKLTMAASLEGRVPLLDHKLVEFAARLPPRLKMNGAMRKYLLKKVARKWLPPEIITRKKKGFPVPVPRWLRTSARPIVHDLLSSERVQQRGLFDPCFVQQLVHEHETGFADHSTMIYGLMQIELWHRLFLDRQPGAMRAYL